MLNGEKHLQSSVQDSSVADNRSLRVTYMKGTSYDMGT